MSEQSFYSRSKSDDGTTAWFVGIIVGMALLAIAYLVFFANSAPAAHPPAPKAGSTVMVSVDGGHGSGVYIGNGFVLTAAHVTDLKAAVDVISETGQKVSGRVLWGSLHQGGYDVSLVYVEGFDAISSPLLCGYKPVIGQNVVLKGNPEDVRNATSWGKISGTSSTGMEKNFGDYGWQHLVTLDLTAAPGNSGGPVFDTDGNVIGILVAGMIDYQRGAMSFSFMVPASDICTMLGRV